MSVMSKLYTALRGATNEAGETIVDQQALRILDQEMREAKKELSQAKGHLAGVISQRNDVAREAARLRTNITEHEEYAAKALDKGDEALAEDVCERIAGFEEELALQERALAEYDTGLNQLKRSVKSTERNIAAMERQVSLIRATEKIQKASMAANSRFAGSDTAMFSATDSLERIRQRQEERAYRVEAAAKIAAESDGSDLEQRLREAGIIKGGPTRNDVMARVRARRSKQ